MTHKTLKNKRKFQIPEAVITEHMNHTVLEPIKRTSNSFNQRSQVTGDICTMWLTVQRSSAFLKQL